MPDDSFYLAWLARECRFQCSIHFEPKALLGYSPVRRAVVSPRREPQLQDWLATKGVKHRYISDLDEIRVLLRLLSPVREQVRDIENMDRLTKMLTKPLRGLTHEELFDIFLIFSSLVSAQE